MAEPWRSGVNYRKLGKSGLTVSEIGLGAYLTYGEKLDFASSQRCIRRAFDLGINLFDTADVYAKGEAERFLGRALKEFPRNRIVLATKCFFPMSEDPNDRGLSRKHIVESVERSLNNLQGETVDLFQCHRFDSETPLEETLQVLGDLVRQGKILYWGVSRWSQQQMGEAVRLCGQLHSPLPISNQVPYNILYRECEAGILPACEELGIGVLAYAPLAQGVLTGKYSGGHIPQGSRASDPHREKGMYDMSGETLAKVDRLKILAREMGLPLAQLALAWCLRRSTVSSVLMGATRPEQIEENMLASGLRLTQEILHRIDEILVLGRQEAPCRSN